MPPDALPFPPTTPSAAGSSKCLQACGLRPRPRPPHQGHRPRAPPPPHPHLRTPGQRLCGRCAAHAMAHWLACNVPMTCFWLGKCNLSSTPSLSSTASWARRIAREPARAIAIGRQQLCHVPKTCSRPDTSAFSVCSAASSVARCPGDCAVCCWPGCYPVCVCNIRSLFHPSGMPRHPVNTARAC